MSGTSSAEAQNLEVVRRGYEAFGKGDMPTLQTLFAPTASWNAVGAGVLPGNYRGVKAILEFFGKLAHETEGTVRVEPQAMAAARDRVFVLERLTGTRKGRTINTTSVLAFTLANGLVTEVNEFPYDYPATAQFWS